MRENAGMAIVCLLLAFCLNNRVVFADPAPNDQSVREVLLTRQAALGNLDVIYDIHETFSPPPELTKKAAVAGLVARTQPQVGEGRFRFLNGRAWYEWQNKQPLGVLEPGVHAHEITAYSNDRVELAWKSLQGSRYSGRISNSELLPPEVVIDVALGLREIDSRDRSFKGNVFKDFTVSHTDDGAVTLTRSTDTSGDRREEVLLLDPKVGYALVQYDLFLNGEVYYHLHNGDFKKVEQLFLPFVIKLRKYYKDSEFGPAEVASKELRVKSYRLNDPSNTPDSYLISWPDKAHVSDVRSKRQVVVSGGPKRLDDETLKQYTAAYQPDDRSLRRGSSRRWLLVSTFLGLLIIIGGIVYYRRLSKRARALLPASDVHADGGGGKSMNNF